MTKSAKVFVCVCVCSFGVYFHISHSQKGIAINLMLVNGFWYMLQCYFKWFVTEFSAVTITTNTLAGFKQCICVIFSQYLNYSICGFDHFSLESSTRLRIFNKHFRNSAPQWKIHCIYQALTVCPLHPTLNLSALILDETVNIWHAKGFYRSSG